MSKTLPHSSYSVIYADPAWEFDDDLPGKGRGSSKHYRVLKQHELVSFLSAKGVGVSDPAWLFLWRVGAKQNEALEVAESWGFEVKSEIIWVKTTMDCKRCAGTGCVGREGNRLVPWRLRHGDRIWCDACSGWGHRPRIGMGRTVRNTHEVCLIAQAGKPVTVDKAVPSVIFAKRQEHSRKPDLLYHVIDRLTGGLQPRIELFARRRRENWDAIGDELPVL